MIFLIQNSIYFPNEEQRPKFDIYSFGVIALEMLMPKEIADSEKNKHQNGHEIARIGKSYKKSTVPSGKLSYRHWNHKIL